MVSRKKESYSSLSLLKQCPLQYKFRYIDKIYRDTPSISLDLGNLCHKILEIQRSPKNKNSTYEELLELLEKGYYSDKENLSGLEEISDKYYEEYVSINAKSNLSYIDKINIFKETLKNYKPDKNWEVVATELPFSFTYKDFKFTGKIDRVDKNKDGHYRVIDYKTSNMVYKDKELTTPLQMYIYALAINKKFGEFPIEFIYDFVLLGEQRRAMSKGWKNRGNKILDKIVESRKEFYETETFPPTPTPLCFWCPYREKECDYYSLWTPDNKTFEVNKKFEGYETPNENDWW